MVTNLVNITLQLLFLTKINYHQFFRTLKHKFSLQWRNSPDFILDDLAFLVTKAEISILKRWCWFYHQLLLERSHHALKNIAQKLQQTNPSYTLEKTEIESIEQAIRECNNWQPFTQAVEKLVILSEED